MRTLVLERNDRRAEATAQLGMSFIRIKAVGHLARAPMTMRELAVSLAVDRPYTTVVVDDLESRGLVERRPDPQDGRRKIVALTAAGRRLASRASDLLDDPPAVFAGLPSDELAHLDRIMQLLVSGEESDAGEPSADR